MFICALFPPGRFRSRFGLVSDASDQRFHAIKETRSGASSDLYDDLTRYDKCTRGHGTAKAVRFTNHGRRFTCNGGFVNRCDSLRNFTVTGDELSDFYDNSISGPQLPRLYLLNRVVFRQAIGDHLTASLGPRTSLILAALFGERSHKARK